MDIAALGFWRDGGWVGDTEASGPYSFCLAAGGDVPPSDIVLTGPLATGVGSGADNNNIKWV